MNFIKLKNSTNLERGLVGGKFLSLSSPGIVAADVPDAFVITTSYFKQAIDNNQTISVLVDSLVNQNEVQKIAKNIRSKILELKFDKEVIEELYKHFDDLGSKVVAVRSSAPEEDGAENSWAGQFETLLGVNKDNLEKSILECWASLFSERAITYRTERRLALNNFSIAVIVQKMLDPEISGVAFSNDPVNGKDILIECVYGLGEALVGGEITPSHYLISKKTPEVRSSKISRQSTALKLLPEGGYEWHELVSSPEILLTADQIQVLTEKILVIESAWGVGVDIEWCFEKDKLYILQVRPITAESVSDPLFDNLRGLKGKFSFAWGEVHSVISAENWLSTYVTHQDIPANDCKFGFCFIENSCVTTYFSKDDEEHARNVGEVLCEQNGFQKYLDHSKKNQAGWAKLYENWSKELKRNTEILLKYYSSYQELFDETYALYKISQPEYTETAADKLRHLLKNENQEFMQTLTSVTELDIVQEEELELSILAKKEVLTEEEIEKHARYHPWLFFNTYSESVALSFLRNRIEDLRQNQHYFHLESTMAKFSALKAEKTKLYNMFSSDEIVFLSEMLSKLSIDRYKLKAWWTGSEYLFLDLFDEIAQVAELNVKQLLQSYRSSEITQLLLNNKKLSKDVIHSRTSCYCVLLVDGVYSFVDGHKAYAIKNMLIEPQQKNQSDLVIGTVANSGFIRAKVKIIRVEGLETLLKDMAEFSPGDILVTTMTQPTMMALARKAGGIITDEGGITSHASVIARELGIPCVVGTKVATEIFQNGDLIELDAFSGTAKKL